MNSILKATYCTESVPKDVVLNLFQYLHVLFKTGDTGAGSGRTKFSLFVVLILFAVPTQAQENTIQWHPFEEAIQIAEKNQLPLLVDVWAPWCGWCKKMKKEVYPEFSDDFSSQFVWTRLNRDDNETSQRYKNQSFTPLRLSQSLNVQGVPALIFMSPQADYLFHTSGFTKTESLEPLMQYVASNAYQRESFESFLAKHKNR